MFTPDNATVPIRQIGLPIGELEKVLQKCARLDNVT